MSLDDLGTVIDQYKNVKVEDTGGEMEVTKSVNGVIEVDIDRNVSTSTGSDTIALPEQSVSPAKFSGSCYGTSSGRIVQRYNSVDILTEITVIKRNTSDAAQASAWTGFIKGYWKDPQTIT